MTQQNYGRERARDGGPEGQRGEVRPSSTSTQEESRSSSAAAEMMTSVTSLSACTPSPEVSDPDPGSAAPTDRSRRTGAGAGEEAGGTGAVEIGGDSVSEFYLVTQTRQCTTCRKSWLRPCIEAYETVPKPYGTMDLDQLILFNYPARNISCSIFRIGNNSTSKW